MYLIKTRTTSTSIKVTVGWVDWKVESSLIKLNSLIVVEDVRNETSIPVRRIKIKLERVAK